MITRKIRERGNNEAERDMIKLRFGSQTGFA
jgi:hypothetical protein